MNKNSKTIKRTLIGISLVLGIVLGTVLSYVFITKTNTINKTPKIAVSNSIIVKNVNGTPTVVDRLDKNLPTLTVFLDLQCPACKQFEQATEDVLRKKLEENKVQIQYNIVSFLDSVGGGFSSKAGSSLVTVAQEQPDKFFDYMSALYSVQPEESSNVVFEDSLFGNIAINVGIKPNVATRIGTFEYAEWVKNNVQVFSNNPKFFENGQFATPTVFLNDKKINLTKPFGKTLDSMVK